MMAAKWKEAIKKKGPTSVGMFGSGQWTIWEGYAAAKFMKAGLRSRVQTHSNPITDEGNET